MELPLINQLANTVDGDCECACVPVVHHLLCLSSTYSRPSSDAEISGDNGNVILPLEYFTSVSSNKIAAYLN